MHEKHIRATFCSWQNLRSKRIKCQVHSLYFVFFFAYLPLLLITKICTYKGNCLIVLLLFNFYTLSYLTILKLDGSIFMFLCFVRCSKNMN